MVEEVKKDKVGRITIEVFVENNQRQMNLKLENINADTAYRFLDIAKNAMNSNPPSEQGPSIVKNDYIG